MTDNERKLLIMVTDALHYLTSPHGETPISLPKRREMADLAKKIESESKG